jgi:hypothetical protein
MADAKVEGKLGKRLVLPRLIYCLGDRKQGFTIDEMVEAINKECPTEEERLEALSVLPALTTIRERLDELKQFGTLVYDYGRMRYHVAGVGENRYI